ncbi:8200_t:CDS:1 [Paraglomus brasilianum]|uniref:8200_t:CDS:1 n=1 Tax=Paraglomus brasilianum TaxID=144538 RepID=A0A9N8ZVM3_9GLOM|nr:8200_t:CDS:1 [Paraglomus brasilianum]
MSLFCAVKIGKRLIRFGKFIDVGAVRYPFPEELVPGFGNFDIKLVGVRPVYGTGSIGFDTNQVQSETYKSMPTEILVRPFDKRLSKCNRRQGFLCGNELAYFSTGPLWSGQAKTDIRNEHFQSILQVLRVDIHYNIAIVLVFSFKKENCFSKKFYKLDNVAIAWSQQLLVIYNEL